MSNPDPVTTGVVLAGALQIAKQAQEFIAAVAGHPGESLGTIVGNFTRRRVQNVEGVGNKAHLILLELGVEPQEIPLTILQPLLDSASLEENTTLQDLWANLLANAADSRNTISVQPVFIEMLKALSWREVRFLDVLTRDANNIGSLELNEEMLARLYLNAGLASAHPREGPQVPNAVTADNILGSRAGGEFYTMMDIIERQRIIVAGRRVNVNSVQQKTFEYSFTQLGREFLRACQKPRARGAMLIPR
jgi:hypothetical protein